MFRKTQIRLVMLNVIVVILLLNGLGGAFYFTMKYRLYLQVDGELTRIAAHMKDAPIPPMRMDPPLRLDRKKWLDFDRRIILLMWDGNYQMLGKAFGETMAEDELLQFRMTTQTEGIRTLTVNQQPYRVYTLPLDKMVVLNGEPQNVHQVQLIYNLEPEEKMLSTLVYVLAIGEVVGIIIAVVTGTFLARRALVPIKRSWEKQQQFVADASHELRTPLSVILINLEQLFLYPEHTIEQESETISITIQEGKRLNKLISNLLTLARSDSNELQILHQKVRLEEVVKKSVQSFEPLAQLKMITLTTDLEEPLEVYGDEGRLHQLIVILLDNALKYTNERGTITISCKHAGNSALLTVTDTGIGIPKSDLHLIFDRFYRGDKMRSRAEEGTGLGLSIAKWIIEAHRGKVRVESEEGVGTSFFITLPTKYKENDKSLSEEKS
ncbi:sensor histidine kinase [Brevibacillus fulvus]|uniref:histidine kinase n=1 Tax=Brevibacillus fulvus TaxID=1125967 RepID=A0A938Y035_9BACL|nr:HAMP domain-containing sensor histidine kinase [Brevibacillus fulvus]MBM7591429.1 signal transduction histidine kinase [Brevibacillus fulvus]